MKNKNILIGILIAVIVFLSFAITSVIVNYYKNKRNIQVVATQEEKVDVNVVNETSTWNIVSEENTVKEENIVKENAETKTDTNKTETNISSKNTTTSTTKKSTTAKKTSSKKSTKSSKNKYYIKINIAANVVNIYKQDDNGNYTVPYKAMICSTGKATPKAGNVYTLSDRGAWGMMVGNVWAQYYTRITGAILFHSVPYTKKNKSSLEYWEYDKLGTKASAGCIRLTVKDSKWIYDNCPAGTKVEFYSDSNPGPLGKPSAQKISSQSNTLRGWDPTDPDSNNPWKNVKIKDQEQNNTTTTKTDTNTIPKTEDTGVNNNQNDKKENVNNVDTNTTSGSTSSDTKNIDNTNKNEENNNIDNTVGTTE